MRVERLHPEIGEYRWLVHTVDFFRYTNKYDFCAIEYEEWFRKPLANVAKLQQFLDLPWQQSEDDLALVLSGIIDPAARHDDANHPGPSQPQVRSLYELARRLGHDGVREEIASIVSRFVGFQQLQRPFIAGFEDIAQTAVKYSEIAREVASLRTVIGERDADLAAADARAATAEGRLAEALVEIEAQRGQIAELSSERDQAGGLKTVLAEREATLADLSRQLGEIVGALALEAARAEAAAREAALAQAERASQEQEVAQADVRVLREKLAATERENEQRTAYVAALQFEIATLRGTLAAARQVGKAATAAFRIETAAAATPLSVADGDRP
jgi:hypothetical protein